MRRTIPQSSGREPHKPVRWPPAPDTDPIDLRELARSFPPRPAEVYQPFADGRRPQLPSAAEATMTLIGAPIPHADIADPEPPRRPAARSLLGGLDAAPFRRRTPWTPRRRRRFVRTAAGVTLLVSVVLVLVAAVSVLAG